MTHLRALALVRNSDNDDQSRLWRNYSAALNRAERTGAPQDIHAALTAWDQYLRRYLPDAEQRRAIPRRRLLVGRAA